MSFNILKTRRGKLRAAIEKHMKTQDVEGFLKAIDEYEQDNLNTIEKLKLRKDITLRKIKGGLKQTIDAHGPITKELIGSATKRVYGMFLENKRQNIIKRLISCIKQN